MEDFWNFNPDVLNPALSARPLWLLDIDGVINAYAFKAYTSKKNLYPDLTKYSVPNANRTIYTFWTSPTLMRQITELHDSGLVEIAWLTTWTYDANAIVAPILGLPEFPVVADSGGRFSDYYWKTRTAVEALTQHRPIIWTDDDAITSEARYDYEASDVPNLMIEPKPNQGITPASMDAIIEFILNAH